MHREKSTRSVPKTNLRIAVIIPIGYLGGSFRGAKLLAEALLMGSTQAGEPAQIVFAHIEDRSKYPETEFDDLPNKILRREFTWKTLNKIDAKRAMTFAGHADWEPSEDQYMFPDDGIQQFSDCDLWVIISDRLILPLLPLRPYVLMVYDYLQRYAPVLQPGQDTPYLHAAHHAALTLVTTRFTESDALNYAALKRERVLRVPMIAPQFSLSSNKADPKKNYSYFVWTTNPALHKNHENAVAALEIYYEELAGTLDCIVTGHNSRAIKSGAYPHLVRSAANIEASSRMKEKIIFPGELSTQTYQTKVCNAAFLWHPGKIDNGTFAVIEAAYLGVPSLSSDYPPMREIDAQYQLNLTWANPESPREIARQLKYMEENAVALRAMLPTQEQLQSQSVEHLSAQYWQAIRRVVLNNERTS